MQEDTNENTNGLPQDRKAAIEYGLAQVQQISHDRDVAVAERNDLSIKIKGYQVALDAQDARINDLESRCRSLTMERDEAVAHRTKWEALFASLMAQLRAFEVPNEPIIKDLSIAERQRRAMNEDALTILQRLANHNYAETTQPVNQ